MRLRPVLDPELDDAVDVAATADVDDDDDEEPETEKDLVRGTGEVRATPAVTETC
jgi:hypothetical protein